MREVWVSGLVRAKVADLEVYLLEELKLSKTAALRHSNQMRTLVHTLGSAADYPLCRFKKWQTLGYRCVVFEKSWVFAYEVFENGIIIRDMSHTSLLTE